ncbi:orexin receptor type 2-like [Gigantopelta aegis]|uniref:orexin receptor type 2-like n=1 Tax=Gigantopelta aegis TaxID=1735272 RepID=UPI001B88AC66|nr:orexin receptor type 2-like [Gigantopelta aegis]XP_041355155.1 orexin receptor type 2-like [Gigantopelta aegis]
MNELINNNNVSVENDISREGALRDDILSLNQKKSFMFLPVIIYLVILMLCGIVGNGLVCYVYRWRFRRTTSNFFILFLAIVDLLSCCLGMPFEVSDLLLPYMFDAPAACKILRFVETWTISASGLTLVCVAFDRYYKLCKPLRRFTILKAKVFCSVAVSIALLMALPALALFGRRSLTTGVADVNGTECSIDDHMVHTPLAIIYYGSLMLTFIFTFSCLLTLYIIIGVCLHRRNKLTIGEQITLKTDYPRTHRFVQNQTQKTCHSESSTEDNSKTTENAPKQLHDNKTSRDSNRLTKTPSLIRKENGHQHKMGTVSLKTTRLTAIFFTVSVAFVISFLPYLIVNIMKVTKVAFDPFRSDTVEIVYNFCVRSYFINNVINPFIYSILNVNFRKECKYVFKKLFKSCHNK